jgi:hypothetical protein
MHLKHGSTVLSALTLFFCCYSPVLGDSLPKDWRKALVSIELPDLNNPNRIPGSSIPYRPIGTGFFVTPDTHAPFRGILFTARHVFEGACSQGTDVFLRVEESPSTPDAAIQRIPLTICDKRVVGTNVVSIPRWINHPRVDLAAMLPQFPAQTHLPVINPFPFSLIASAADLEKWHVAEGEDVFLLAFYPNAEPDRPSSAIVRQGVIAEFQEQSDTFLISLPAFPGNSGAPLILRPTIIHFAGDTGQGEIGTINPSLLMGVVVEYVPYLEPAISPQTGRVRVMFEENSGLTRVIRSERIRELLAQVTATIPARP